MKLFEASWSNSIPGNLPIVPTIDVVAFPQMIIPLLIVDSKIIEGIQQAMENGSKLVIVVACKKNLQNSQNSILPTDLYSVGTVANIIRVINLSNGNVKILIQGITRATISNITINALLTADINPMLADTIEVNSSVINDKISFLKKLAEELAKNDALNVDFVSLLSKMTSADKIADFIISHLTLSVGESQKLLESKSYIDFFDLIGDFLAREGEISKLNQKVKSRARESMNNAQKEFYVREQIKALKEEIGEEIDEIDKFAQQLDAIKPYMSEETYKEIVRSINRLESMSSESAEGSVLKTYLECIFDLPWNIETEDNNDIENAKRILDEDHYGLNLVKERILDFLSVKMLSKDCFGTILCFHGPPGTGKTSLAHSIARAIGRKSFRVSVGGMRDEAEIRGHRRTYVGAMPGRFIKGIKQAKSKNPLIIIDEIDKIGSDFKGDPASALLELLDYQQNNMFYDYYLGVPFDLSKALFITTANNVDTIPHALKDRMELIEMPAYTLEEKQDIAARFLITRAIKHSGLEDKSFSISQNIIETIIAQYTYEAGVRELDRVINKICSRAARFFVQKKEEVVVDETNLELYLGAPKFLHNTSNRKDKIGVANGMCWTPCGGDILHIEAVLLPGKGNLILTGQLGSVMKESAQAALTYIRSHAESFEIEESLFLESDIHIHVPAGAISKDGPSAGVAIMSSMLSVIKQVPFPGYVAMTGEIDLQGNVLPVGGIKEKILAAKRNNMKIVIMPLKNKHDVVEIAHLVEDLEIYYVDTVVQVVSNLISIAEQNNEHLVNVQNSLDENQQTVIQTLEEQIAI